MNYLLDTNVISEARKGKKRVDPSVQLWFDSMSAYSLKLSVITIVELETGILRREARDAAQGRVLRQWFEKQIINGFHGRILPVTLAIARKAAKYHVPNPKPNMDALIGATAAVNDCAVVTRNVKDFVEFDVEVINPWEFNG